MQKDRKWLSPDMRTCILQSFDEDIEEYLGDDDYCELAVAYSNAKAALERSNFEWQGELFYSIQTIASAIRRRKMMPLPEKAAIAEYLETLKAAFEILSAMYEKEPHRIALNISI